MTSANYQGPTQVYINGQWRLSSDGSRIDISDLSNEQVIATVAAASEQDAMDAVVAAAFAGPKWAARPPRERREIRFRYS